MATGERHEIPSQSPLPSIDTSIWPRVIEEVIACVNSWTMMSFAKHESRASGGFQGGEGGIHKCISMTGWISGQKTWHTSSPMFPGMPLKNVSWGKFVEPFTYNSGTGALNDALPASSLNCTVTSRRPFPPLARLLSWKFPAALYAVSTKILDQKLYSYFIKAITSPKNTPSEFKYDQW